MLQRECVDGIHERNIEFGIKRIDSYYDISLKTKNILKTCICTHNSRIMVERFQ